MVKRKTGPTSKALELLASLAEELAASAEEALPEAVDSIDKLPDIIARERSRQEITIRELADLAGLSLQTIVNIEAGAQSSRLENVRKVLQVLGKDLCIK